MTNPVIAAVAPEMADENGDNEDDTRLAHYANKSRPTSHCREGKNRITRVQHFQHGLVTPKVRNIVSP